MSLSDFYYLRIVSKIAFMHCASVVSFSDLQLHKNAGQIKFLKMLLRILFILFVVFENLSSNIRK